MLNNTITLNTVHRTVKEKNHFLVFISVQTLREELEDCSHALAELDVAMQEFGEQNPLLARQLSTTLNKLTELHSQTIRLAEGRTSRLKKVNDVLTVLYR